MNKLKIDIINDTMNNKIHLSIDNGEFQVTEKNNAIQTLLRVIRNPDRYEIEISEY